MKHSWSIRKKGNGKVNPYPMLLLVALLLFIIFIVFHFFFKNPVF